MTEAVSVEPVVISAETSLIKEKVVKRKTIVYEPHVSPSLITDACQKLKQQLFTKFAFYWFQPKLEDIQFVSLEKYFEPYIVISGKYLIDYLRECTYVLNVDEGVMEVILSSNTYMPETCKLKRIVKLCGQERLVKQATAFLILNKNGVDCSADSIPVGTPAKKPEKEIKEFEIEELAENADVNFLRERIVKRPKDMYNIVEEVFEVTERTVIYCPRYKLLFRWVKTGEERTLVLDAVTAQRVKQP